MLLLKRSCLCFQRENRENAKFLVVFFANFALFALKLYFPKFKLVKMRKMRAFRRWFIFMQVRLFGQSRIKIGGKKRKTANSGDFILPILTRFWKGQIKNTSKDI